MRESEKVWDVTGDETGRARQAEEVTLGYRGHAGKCYEARIPKSDNGGQREGRRQGTLQGCEERLLGK